MSIFFTHCRQPDAGNGLYGEMADSAPRLYLAGGVTTARTAGSLEPYTDLELKKQIDAGLIPGSKTRRDRSLPRRRGTFALQMHQLADADDAGRTVDYWAAEGVTSFKAYNYITADELKMAIRHAHFRGLKITGHLCSIGFKEAADMGIDNLEHGIVVDTEFYSGKQPDVCPDASELRKRARVERQHFRASVQDMIHDLVEHHVAVTSTLAILETPFPIVRRWLLRTRN